MERLCFLCQRRAVRAPAPPPIERGEVGVGQRERRGANQAVDLGERGSAGDGRGDARLGDQPRKRSFGRPGAVERSDRRERVDNPQAARIEIAAYAAAARALAEIGGRAVLAGQESFGEAVIGDDADFFGHAEIAQRAFEAAAIVEIVLGLQDFIARQSMGSRRFKRGGELRGAEFDAPHQRILPFAISRW